MRQLINTFLDEMLAQGGSPNTVRTYRSGLHLFAGTIGKPLAELASRDVHVWLMGIKGISPSRRHNIRCSLATFFDWCRRWDHIPEERDLMFRVGTIKRPRVARPWLTQRQVRKIMGEGCRKALRGFLRLKTMAFIRFISFTSWRLNEVLSMRWQDIDYERGCISYKQKGGAADIYPIDDKIEALLKEYRAQYDKWMKRGRRKGTRNVAWCEKNDYVFPSKRGTKWTKAYYPVRAAGEAVGIELKPSYYRQALKNIELAMNGADDGEDSLFKVGQSEQEDAEAISEEDAEEVMA